jgi:hypothetical protein
MRRPQGQLKSQIEEIGVIIALGSLQGSRENGNTIILRGLIPGKCSRSYAKYVKAGVQDLPTALGLDLQLPFGGLRKTPRGRDQGLRKIDDLG